MVDNVGAGVFSKGVQVHPMRVSLRPWRPWQSTQRLEQKAVCCAVFSLFLFFINRNSTKSDILRTLALAVIISTV